VPPRFGVCSDHASCRYDDSQRAGIYSARHQLAERKGSGCSGASHHVV